MTAASLVPHLTRCRYHDALLERDYDFGSGRVPVAAFADTPHDTRSICIAAVDAPSNPKEMVASTKPLGAPVVFACHGNKVQWWKQTTGAPELLESVDNSRVREFFRRHKNDLKPTRIFEGKTRLRLPGQTQLSFVDAGLMPFVERTEGERLSRLVETAFRDIEGELKRELKSEDDARNAIKATFWLLAAKALHDKNVDGFKIVDLTDIDRVFTLVGRHYGVPDGVPPPGEVWHAATSKAAERISDFDNLRNLSTESLAHVYENALVTKAVRKANGTHSTPGPLVDYIVWQLIPWIEALPPERRHVFEPACGHSAFLVSALRILRQWSDIKDGKACHNYLKKHLYGVEDDEFALEVARLSLSLADVPYGNKWNLKRADMFLGTTLEDGAKNCGIFLANPPYEKFTKDERAKYARARVELVANTKACEMLRRTIPYLGNDACFGVVVPQGLLHSSEGTELRRTILSDFALSEIDIFEDKLFEKGDHEAAVLMGRRKRRKRTSGKLSFRRVRNTNIEAFREQFAFSSEDLVDVSRFVEAEIADFRVPECDAVWRSLDNYPTLSDIAEAGQGFSFRGRDLPKDAETLSKRSKPGYKPCFVTSRGNPPVFKTPGRQWMNPCPTVIQSARRGVDGEPGQVIVNHAPVSRDKWRMKAWLDQEGIAVKGNFLVVRSKTSTVPGVLIWALLNSPVANAFVYCRMTKRHIIGGDLLRLPIPGGSGDWMGSIVSAAQAYLATTKDTGGFFQPDPAPAIVKARLLAMDAAVLRAYDLSPRLERQLLDLFTGVERKGVGCKFTGYYPPGFSSCLPLHLLLSERFQRAAAGATADRFKPGGSAHVREVLTVARAGMDGGE